MVVFEPGTLWPLIEARTAAALRNGALCPIDTSGHTVLEGDVSYLVRAAAAPRNKSTPASTGSNHKSNPFLPFDERLFVAEVTEDYLALLNKFNVAANHMLLVTRTFIEQSTPLGRGDFVAWIRCLSEFDGLGFYNSGPEAGASQPHRHLQLIPLPRNDAAIRFPLEARIVSSLHEKGPPHDLITSGNLPYKHWLVKLSSLPTATSDEAAEEMAAQYLRMLGELEHSQSAPGAYNLLVTKQWMLMIPRKCESYESISLNALAFAGAFFVRTPEELSLLRDSGPEAAMRFVTSQD